MDHTEFKQYLSHLEELSPAQKRKLSDVLRVKDEGETVAETFEKRMSGDGHCSHCKHNQFHKKDSSLKGIVEADETFFLESFKGSRNLGRTARKRGGKATKRWLSAEQIPVLIARDRHGEMTDDVLKDLSEVSITKVLKPVLAQDVVLCTDGNQSYRSFADTENIAHVRLIASNESRVINKVYHIQNVNAYDGRLKGWMRRFNGVATKYLPNYLGWRRCLEKQRNSIASVTYLSCALE